MEKNKGSKNDNKGYHSIQKYNHLFLEVVQ
jgi:hypothetical protein